MRTEDDAKFIRNFSMILVFLVVAGIAAFILAKVVGGNSDETQNNDVLVAERLAPVGKVNIGEPFIATASGEPSSSAATDGASAVADVTPDPGKAAYGKICFACHDAGIGGAPKLGDAAAWAGRTEKGAGMLSSNAITGFTGETGIMPAKGGLNSLSDDEVTAAVDYMLVAIGIGDAAATTTTQEPTPGLAVAPVADGRGKEVYDGACFICHATGVAGAPKIGDSNDWNARATQGIETLYTHAVKGFMGETGLMPPKGGRMDYSDEDVKAAVDYMIDGSQ
jgi:cytochrome c5